MPDNETATAATEHSRVNGSLFHRILILPTTLLGVIIGNQFFSNTWACAIIPATIIVWFACIFTYAVVPALRSEDHRSRRWRIVAVLVLGILAGAVYPVGRNTAFRECFGFDRPADVHNLRVIAKHYEGATEHTLIIEFNAEADVVAGLLSDGGFADTGDYITAWLEAGGTWQALEDTLVGFRPFDFSTRSFRRLVPMTDFEVFEASPRPCAWNVLIWDRDANRVVVLNILG